MDRFSAHLDRGWDLAMRGQTTGALIAARQALEINKDAPEALNLMGYVRALEGDYDEALECYRRAIDLDEWYLEPILNAAELLAHPEADPEEAIRLCRRAGEMELGNEELADALLIEVDALLSLGKNDEARARLESCEKLESLPVQYLVAVGRMLFELGEPEKARAFLDRAVADAGATADAFYTRGVIARESGRRLDAVLDFLETLERDTSDAGAGATGDPAQIGKALERAVAMLPQAARAQLLGTEFLVVERPTADQVRSEIDPRQVVLAEGIDPARPAFERVWVFCRNLERIVIAAHWEEELTRQLAAELGFDLDDDESAPPSVPGS